MPRAGVAKGCERVGAAPSKRPGLRYECGGGGGRWAATSAALPPPLPLRGHAEGSEFTTGEGSLMVDMVG